MGITENAAYLKGLFDGYEIDKTTKEGKIMSSMLDLIADMADKIAALEADNKELHEYVEELDHDLGELEEEVYFCDEDDCDCDCDECDCEGDCDDCDCMCDCDCCCCEEAEEVEVEEAEEAPAEEVEEAPAEEAPQAEEADFEA